MKIESEEVLSAGQVQRNTGSRALDRLVYLLNLELVLLWLMLGEDSWLETEVLEASSVELQE